MTYRKRIFIALLFSLLLHATAVAVWSQWPEKPASFAVQAKPEPLVLTLNPPQPQPLRRIVESVAPAQRPVQDTDLISDRDTQAQDQSDRMGARAQPAAERLADFEDTAGPPPSQPAAAPPTTVARAVPPTPAEQQVQREEAQAERRREQRPDALPVLRPEKAEPEEEQETKEAQRAEEEPAPEPFDLAQASPSAVTATPAPPSMAAPSEGAPVARDDGGVVDRGLFSFEAHQHELGPYLLEVRRKVERRWRANMRLRYSGSGPADAMLECAISPEGRIVEVKIIEAGRSATFAALCKQAIEQAAPFSAFPFEVPAVYQDENLVIRWKFSFL